MREMGNPAIEPENHLHSLAEDFLLKKTLAKKLTVLKKIYNRKTVNKELLEAFKDISNNLEKSSDELWRAEKENEENYEESADSIISSSDYEKSIIEPIIDRIAAILRNAKDTEYQEEGEAVLIELLKNWNSFEVFYFKKTQDEEATLMENKSGASRKITLEEVESDLAGEEYHLIYEFSNENTREYFNDTAVNHSFIDTKNRIIKSLELIGGRKSIDSLISTVLIGRRSAHNFELSAAFKNIDKEYAVKKLVPLLNDKDKIIRENTAAVIFTMNFFSEETKEFFRKNPQSAGLLENAYAVMIYNSHKEVDEVYGLCEEIFFKKKFDKNQIIQAILKQSNDFLAKAIEKIKYAPDDEKNKIVKEAVEEFKKQQDARKEILDDFKKTALELNRRYAEIYKKYDDLKHEQFKHGALVEEFGNDYASGKEADEYSDYIDTMREMQYHPATAWSAQEAEESIKLKERIDRHFDSERIKNIIEETWQYSGGWANRDGKISDFRDELEDLLDFQNKFEAKLEKIIYGQESADLPKELLENLPREIQEVRPERLPLNEPIYFPVGISKELPEWQKVLEGDQKCAKPIDIYGYLFWLENQGRPVELVVCDEIQTANYTALYSDELGDDPDVKARELARKIGQKEKEQYQKIIDTFRLDNIKIVDYREFLGKEKDKFEKYRALCEMLYKNPIWAEAMLSLAQESVGHSKTKEEKEKILPYAFEEIAWILSVNGSKISHLNEARYDAAAAVIKNVENYASKRNIDIFDPENQDKLPAIINGALEGLRNHLRARKSISPKSSSTFKYYEAVEKYLGKIRRTADRPAPGDFNKKSAEFPFASPETGSQSFGWRGAGEEREEAVIKFKEPYSTYFYKNDTELFLESDQVVAAHEGQISGKILTMPAEVQKQYAEKTVKPILIHFFKMLENAPEEYFEKIGKNREELLKKCQEANTLLDLLRFIQKYAVRPTLGRKIRSN